MRLSQSTESPGWFFFSNRDHGFVAVTLLAVASVLGFSPMLPQSAAGQDDLPAVVEAGRPQGVLLPIQVDGSLSEPAWSQSVVQANFVYPWADRPAPATTFRVLTDTERVYFAFEVKDDEVIVEREFGSESAVDKEDRVEVFFAADAALKRYYCLEIDPLGRVHDYAASSYRKFDNRWNCLGLRTAGRLVPGGYVVEAAVPLRTLSSLLGRRLSSGESLRVGLFRAEFRKDSQGERDDNWLSWVRPGGSTPDFHIPSAFAELRLPAQVQRQTGAFRTRGIVLVPEDLAATDWPARAAQAGLTTIALHHGTSTRKVVEFIQSNPGREFLEACARYGLHVEYELHAMRDLLPRELFSTSPGLFRMNENGKRTPDANLCVHSESGLEIVASNALQLARQLPPTTSRYFFWGDDGLPWCRCQRCAGYSDSEQALILENYLVTALRRWNPDASLAHLAYATTLAAPKKVKPSPGIFLEYAPINRRYDVPYAEQTGPDAKDALGALSENLRLFPAETAQALEYWLDVSRFSHWRRPSAPLPRNAKVLTKDLESYWALGIRHVTTFGAWLDADYFNRFGVPTGIKDYGEALQKTK